MFGTVLPRWWRVHFVDVRDAADAAADPGAGGTRTQIILATSAVCLLAIAYLGRAPEPQWLLTTLRAVGLDGSAHQLAAAFSTPTHGGLARLAFWGSARTVGYLIVPMAIARYALRLRPSELGWSTRGILQETSPYLVALAISVPFVVAASFGHAFQARYPFYDPAMDGGLWPYAVGWWAIYAVQFVGVEFFFRGFLVLGLAPRYGHSAVYVAAVPYVMIHFAKPMPEAIGAGITAIVLGTLVLRSRSIWWGVTIHVFAAVLLDVLTLSHKGIL